MPALAEVFALIRQRVKEWGVAMSPWMKRRDVLLLAGVATVFLVGGLAIGYWIGRSSTTSQPVHGDDAREVLKPDFTLTARSPKTWLLSKAKTDGKFLVDRDFTFTKLPRVIEGATLLVRDRDSHRTWLNQQALTASMDGTAYVLFMWKWQGKEQVSEATLAGLSREGWTEVKEEVDTTFPEGEDWKWKTLKKSVKKGDIDLQLKGVHWQETLTLFAFK